MQKYNEKSCGVIIYREEDNSNSESKKKLYLILHYTGGHWDFPKGHMEEGENEKETALRELIEETGINQLEFKQNFREEIFYTYEKFPNKFSTKLVVFFLGKTDLEKVKVSDEHFGFKWLSYEEAQNQITFDNAKQLLKKAEKFLENE